MTHLATFSIIYLLIAGLSLTMGYYAYGIHLRSKINRLFLIISLCMTVWALGFSVILIAPSEASAILWARVSSIGYSLIYSVLLHFTLALTGFDRLLRKWWIHPLIYAPAAVCLYGFVLSPAVVALVHRFTFTANGWARSSSLIAFDFIFQVYFIVYVLISLILIWIWSRRSSSHSIKKQGTLLLASIATAICLGAVTDVANGVYLDLPIPRIAPLLFLIPIGTIFYCISRYHLMKAPSPHSEERIITGSHRKSVYRFASAGLIAGGVLLFLMKLVWEQGTNFWFAVAAGVFPAAIGVALVYLQRKQKSEEILEFLLVLSSLIVIPFILLDTAGSGGLTTWAVPVIIIVCSLVFNMRLVLFTAAATTFLGQVYLWGVTPSSNVLIDDKTYISRIIILLFITASAYYVHHIYKSRLRENAAQARTQTLLSNVSSSFSGINAENMMEKKRALLDTLAEYYGAGKVIALPLSSEYSGLMPPIAYCTDGSEIPPDFEQVCEQRWAAFLSSGGLESFHAMQPPKAAGSDPWLFIPIFASEQAVGFMYFEASSPAVRWTKDQRMTLGIVSRITSGALEKASGENRIRYMAYYDTLTGLPNRLLFNDRANQAINLARRAERLVGIMFLDLDSFKSVNDTLGHEGGDLLIKAVGEKLSSSLRKSDTVARFGGDEFLMLFNSAGSVEDIKAIADKIMHLFKEPIVVKGQELFITASAGISVFPADGEDVPTLIKHADIAMYSAKEKGKNQYALCSANMKELIQYKMALSKQLYRALDNREFAVYYQPQVSLQTGKIVGVEALLRWFHPSLGLIPPSDFIPLAEQTGLINAIGNWVLEIACTQSVVWHRMGFGSVRMAVNLSVVQLRSSNLVGKVRDILERTGVDPKLLELEITESATTREPDYIVGVLNDLKDLGITISIDDFGTEYSSLNRLKMLPIDRLKMDIQFVHGIDKSPKDQAITMVIINLAKNLDLKLVAEGVESPSQLNFLKQRMCDEVQGFYYYKPMPANEIEKLLQEESSCA